MRYGKADINAAMIDAVALVKAVHRGDIPAQDAILEGGSLDLLCIALAGLSAIRASVLTDEFSAALAMNIAREAE